MHSRTAQTKVVNASRRSAVTARAVIVGLALIPLNAYWVILAEMRWYMILTLNPLFVTPVFFLLPLVAANAVFRVVCPQWVLSVPELLVVYVMLAISCTVATHDFIINLITTMGWGTWFATPENKWETTIFPHIPRWALVWDHGVLEGFMEGGESPYRAQVLLGWGPPLLIWLGLVLVMFGVMLCLNVMVRKAWIEETKLSFPVVRLPLAMVGIDTPGFFRSSLTWVGAVLPILNGTLSGLARLYPALPHFETRARWPRFADPPWNRLGAPYSFYPFAIGLGYFVPLDVLFSCWFFYLFIKAQIVVGHYVGVARLPGYPFVMEQGIGAWTMYGALMLYLTREHWKRLFTAIWQREEVDDPDELLPHRLALGGITIGLLVILCFWRVAGMTLLPALVAVGLYFLLALSITRVRAESGSQHTVWDLEPMNVFPLAGTDALGKGNLIGAGLSHWFWRLNRSHAMPTQLEALKLWHSAGLRPRELALPMVLATVASTFAGAWACLHVGYTEGAATKCIGYANWTGHEVYNWLNHMLVVGRPAEWPRVVTVLLASGFTFVLWRLQLRYPWLWLHPLGYCAGPGLIWVWCPFLIAWVLKSTIVRYGGQRLYRRLIPLFLGLILGDYIIGCIWAIVSPILNFQGYQIFH